MSVLTKPLECPEILIALRTVVAHIVEYVKVARQQGTQTATGTAIRERCRIEHGT